MTHIPFKVSLLRLVFLLLPVTVAAQEARLSDYVDPRIGSEGLGRVFIGPSCPYGMVKPSPDCTVHPNSGWAAYARTSQRFLPSTRQRDRRRS